MRPPRFPTVAVCLSEYYFDQLNFISDCHDYIAVTHDRNYDCRCFKMNLQSFSLQPESEDDT